VPIWLPEGKPNVIRRLPKTPGGQLEIARPKGQTRFHKLNPNRRKLCNSGSAETGYPEASDKPGDDKRGDDKRGDRQAVHPLLRIRTDNIPSAQMRDRQRRAVPSDHEFDNWIYLDRQLAPGEQYYWYP
jgi:hypothetical protein